jgi:hypothetical protein
MLRRNFLKSLLCIPAVVSALPSEAKPAVEMRKIEMSSTYGRLMKRWDILSENDILKNGFALVLRPVFTADDQNYCIKTFKMKLWLPPEQVESYTSGEGVQPYKDAAIKELKEMGITHIYSVQFNESPIYNPSNCESLGHMAFVRGAKIYWYPGSIFQKASCEFV